MAALCNMSGRSSGGCYLTWQRILIKGATPYR